MRKLTIGALAIGVLLVMGAVRVVDLRVARADAIGAAETRADNLALILAEYIGESFRAADASLRQLTIHSRRIGGPLQDASLWTPSLASAKAGLTGVGAISVIDPDGIIRHSTRPDIVGQSRRNEYLTQRVMTAGDDELIVGTPFPTLPGPQAPSQLIIPIGRRLSRSDGTGDGSVVASFRPEAPRTLLRDVNVGSGGAITVLHPQGVVLFREPAAEDPIGESAADNPIFTAAQRDRGVLEGPLVPGGPVMLTAFRKTDAPPLIIAVSMDREEVLAGWRREVIDSAAVLIGLSAVLGAVLVILFRQMDAKVAVEQEFALAQTREQEQLRETNERLAAALAREQSARADAEAASALKDDFLMTVSHELRTPLTAIYGWARMLNQGAVGERQRALAIRTIERNAEMQTRLIEDLLDVSGVMTGKLKIDVKPVAPGDIVRNAVETVSPAATAKSIQLETAVDPDVGPLSGDPARLQQIVWNLLSNAVKFTPAGGRVRVSVVRDDEMAAITVADTGIGISPEFLPHVFDRFRQEDSGTRRHFGGLGLGLAIVRSLVELHGGSITARSDGPGTGSVFTVMLPLARMMSAGERSGRAPTDPEHRRRLDGTRILVVDDDAEARELFATILAAAGAIVDVAGSAADALAQFGPDPHDVLISDIEMPDVDGYTLGREALAIARAAGAPTVAIAVTAYARPEDAARSTAAGFVRHVSKPIDPARLVDVIWECFSPPDRRSPAARDGAWR